MDELIYNKTETHEGNDCLITKHAHAVAVDDLYIAVCSTIYRGWMGLDSDVISRCFTEKSDALTFCINHMIK